MDENRMTMTVSPLSDCCHPETAQKHQRSVSNKSHCCHHPTVVVKTIHHQIIDRADFSILHQLQQAVAGIFFNFSESTLPDNVRFESNLANAPPGSWQNIPLYKLHQRFTFYG
ncbi:MAG TPA: hypothetical protein VFL76_06660 [Edaphocola sp.]|nr:hypothetical protein [Edaphocola sp.]